MRPFKVLGVQQIAIGGEDKSKLKKFWIDLMGLNITNTFKSEKENVDEDIAAIGKGPYAVEVDLMQPIDPSKNGIVLVTSLANYNRVVPQSPRSAIVYAVQD